MAKKTYMYYRVSYSEKRDSYSTWVYVGNKKYPDWNDFGLEIECKCVRGYIEEQGETTKETEFVNFRILTAIRQAMKLGYEVNFLDKPE